MPERHATRNVVVHAAPSPFGTVYVVDEGPTRALRFDDPEGDNQTVIDRGDPLAVPMSYARVVAAALAFTPGRARALVVGLGGGLLPLLLRRRLVRMAVDVVELNPVVIDVARRFFGLEEDARLRVFEDDGARFLARKGPEYDFIIVDAFSAEGIPDAFKDPELHENVRRRLAPEGVAVLNIAFESAEGRARLIQSFARPFKGCALLRGARGTSNVLAVGTPAPLPSEFRFRRRLEQLARELRFPELERSVTSFSLYLKP